MAHRVADESLLEQRGAVESPRTSTIEVEAARRGWELGELLTDAASGKTTNRRPALAEALDLLARGEADVLMVAKVDRLARSVADFARIMETAERQGWALVALDLGVDTSTPAGRLMSNVVASVAEYERLLIGQRTREGLAAKRAQGVRLGRPVILPQAVRDRIRADRAAGLSYAAIGANLTAEGVPTATGGKWWPASVRKAEQALTA